MMRVDAADLRRIAIVNRGEPAMRLIHAVREFNREHGTALRTIALVTEPDRRAMFVREADEVYDLGPAMIGDAAGRHAAYVDLARLEAALRDTTADAAWVGWGFVAERPAFVELCERLGVTFIGPPAAVMRRLGDKIAAKRLAEAAGIAVVPWSRGPIVNDAEAVAAAQTLGFPLLVKASAGGGGRGIREVYDEANLLRALPGARAEAAAAFGDDALFLEHRVQGARHLEVQIIADAHGTAWALGVRDCTIQRRHQKVLEEAPSPALSGTEDAALRGAAERLARLAGYRGAGTVEFLLDPVTRTPWFMEVNARLQVEHPVTEATTGVDLVKLQLHLARGGRLEGEPPPTSGHAIEVRLNAEDAESGFAPSPGVIELLRLPSGPGIRIDRGVDEGDVVAPQFDSMIAKITATGRTRDEALARLRRAVADTAVVIRGGTSTKAFLLGLLDRPEVASGEYDTAWLDGLTSAGTHVLHRDADVALLEAAIELHEVETAIDIQRFLASAARGRPAVGREIGHRAELSTRGEGYTLDVQRLGPHDYRVVVGGRPIDVRVDRLGRFERWLLVGDRRHRIVSVVEGASHRVEVDGVPHRISRDDAGVVRSPAPAVVLSVAVAPGDTVARGDRLAVLEAMKMEMSILAPVAGRVRSVLVTPNVQVGAGVALLVLEPTSAPQGEAAGGDRVCFDRLPGAPLPAGAGRRREALETIRRLILGYEVSVGDVRRIAAEWSAAGGVTGDDLELRRMEEALLGFFVDVHALFEPRGMADEPERRQWMSAQEYVLTYLRTFDAGQESLPNWFVERMGRALAHLGVDGLDRTAALEEAWVRIYRSHQRLAEQVPLVMRLLERRLAAPADVGDEGFAAVLDGIAALGWAGHPALADLARELRYRCWDRPTFERAREAVYAEAEARLEALADGPPEDRAERVRWLVGCAQPLVGLLCWRMRTAPPALRRAMLDVLVRRYYRIRDLERLTTVDLEDRSYVRAEYLLDGRRIHVLATHGAYSELAESARALVGLIGDVPAADDVVLDLFLCRERTTDSLDAVADAGRDLLDAVDFPHRLRRIDLTIALERGRGMGDVQHLTYRPGENGYAEERLFRGLHPMMAKRMQLWRLRNFDVERLPSAEDVYLFRGVARGNPKDERLFAIAEVRDLTPVRDEAGCVVRLPHLERMLAEALAGIRLQQAQRPPVQRLHWNRVLLYVWPPLTFAPEDLDRLVRRLAPATAGLGLEKVVIWVRIPNGIGGLEETVLHVTNPGGRGFTITPRPPAEEPIRPLDEYAQKVVRLRRLGLDYPYEIVRMLAPPRGAEAVFPRGEFVEHDLDAAGRLVPVQRPPGKNAANLVVGVIRNFTDRYPEGMTRVCVLGDPSRSMGALAEPECRRIIAALDLAAGLGVPVEWFAVSAGARISMESGTENMDWIAAVLRRLIEFTQHGGEVNVVVAGINVGAQPYWNAEATMLLHTRGILVMTPVGAMVLTGKQALDYSGSVSADDNFGIGGYDRVMGPNGQAQYWARDLADACVTLFRHYEHTYVARGERFPRRAPTSDPVSRDIRTASHGDGFACIGDIFSDAHNPGRKKPFDIRAVMGAAIDHDHPPLERWAAMRDAEIAVVWDAHLGGHPVCLIGIESKPIPRLGLVPADGPEQWTAGTLFPRASKKVARAINAASGNRPVAVLANLSGFDGSPESLRELQLEYGAEIGRAVVNFDGPIVFCVISRFHGGAYVVFSRALNDSVEVAAVEGSYASVIGGAPAAAVVFAGEVEARTRRDPRVAALEAETAAADGAEKVRRGAALAAVAANVHAEKLGEVADEFDRVHNVHRALRVGSLSRIIPAAALRPYLVDAVERGMQRATASARPAGAPQLVTA
jgi:acetyl/propionyl-CoA carboxylase alpha subunit/acetyl-CoA carboxylase carboxyltransferase component